MVQAVRRPALDDALGPKARLQVTLACLALVAGTAVLDRSTGPHLSFAAFYLLPVAICAWWAGFAPGILVTTAGAFAWCAVELAEGSGVPPAATAWNGVTRFGTLCLVASLAARLHARVVRERRLARTDPLTGAANGRHFYEAVAAAADRARQAGRPLSLAYLDLDDFKLVNDRLGHAAGDEVLVHVAETVRAEVGAAGLLARLGGDEFALLLPDAGADVATALLNGVHRRVSEALAKREWPVGVSIGAVTFSRPPGDVDRMVQRADAQMYAAKRNGKGRVEHAVAGDGSDPGSAERRALAQVVSVWTVRVRQEGEASSGEEFATVRDITTDGVRLSVGRRFPAGTLLIVEPLAANARALLARVTGADQERGGWIHRCTLAARLDADDLRAWQAARQPAAPTTRASALAGKLASAGSPV
jgi:diguanylate cyclase (GGDEF)-like protein